jgi:tyrocidine synthetase-3
MKKLDRKNISDILPLTPMQQGMLFHYLKNPDSRRFVEQLRLEISGAVDVRRFEQAWHLVVQANEMLRTVFRWENVEKPVQVILNDYKPPVRFIDLTTANDGQKKQRLEELQAEDREKTFDLGEASVRLTLVRLEEDNHVLIIANHHILYDGWSNGIILREFFKSYDDLSRGKELTRPSKTPFKEFIKWNREKDDETKDDAAFIENYFTGFPPPAEASMRTGQKKEVIDTGNYQAALPGELKKQLEEFIKRHNITAASLFYAAWGLLLHRYHNCRDIVFHATVSGRNAGLKGIEEMVGLFIDTLPLRIRVDDGEGTAEFLARVQHTLQQWNQVSGRSLLRINEYLDQHRQAVLFDSVLVVENYPIDQTAVQNGGALSVKSFSSSGMTGYDLTLLITIFDDIVFHFTYNKDLFDSSTAGTLAGDFIAVIKSIMEHSQGKVPGLVSIPGTVREALLERYDGMTLTAPRAAYAPPRSQVEAKLVEIWADVHRVDRSAVGIDTDFFELGGHSLKAVVLSAEIHKTFKTKIPLAEIFQRPTIRELAELIERTGQKDVYTPIPPAEAREYHSLTPAQRRIYMLQQLNPDSTFYNGPLIFSLKGPIDEQRIFSSFQQLIQRHEALRGSFHQHNGEPVQIIHPNIERQKFFRGSRGAILQKSPPGRRRQTGKNIKNFIKPFDLGKAPLLRIEIAQLAKDEHLLMIDMHHIITDGTSRDILTREFAVLYNGGELPPLTLRYRDYMQWRTRGLEDGDLKPHQDYWLHQLSGDLPVLDLPLDFPRPAVQDYNGQRIVTRLDSGLTRDMRQSMKQTAATPHMVLMAAYNILLGWYSGQEDILVGVPAAGRNHAGLGGTVGLFLETLVARNRPVGGKTFGQFLHDVKQTALAANEHQDYPFSELARQVAAAAAKDLSRNPLFDVMLNVLDQDQTHLEIDGVTAVPYHYDPGVAKVDITLEASIDNDGITLELEYCTVLYRRPAMERFLRHFLNALEQGIHNPDITIGDMELLDPDEKKQILERFNHTHSPYDAKKSVMEYIEARAAGQPGKTAVTGSSSAETLSYEQLNRQADSLANLLRDKGAAPGTIIAVMLDRSPRLIAVLLGVLKSGGAYLPLDPAYPRERLEYMLDDSRASFLISEETVDRQLTFDGQTLLPADWQAEVDHGVPSPIARPHHLAYIIYTSGSTGKPKGVAVRHQNLTAYIHAFNREFKLTENDVVLQQASYSFDVFVEEVYPCLIAGGTLALPPRQTIQDAALLTKYIAANGVTVIDCSPLLLNELNRRQQACGDDPAQPSPLRTVRIFISGGDVLNGQYVTHLLPLGAVYNTYGPTETTVCAAYHRVDGEEGSTVPIGKPIANYRVYILDDYNRLLPVGVPGEIRIAGAGVAPGYVNRPLLTQEKFVADPWRPDERMYRSGDLGKWLPGGGIEFMGRKDRQVKIRGFRIELGEIENRLLAHDAIDNAAVVIVGEKRNAICAYFTASAAPGLKEIKEFLLHTLPGYMVPAYFVQLDELPLTPAGKIDIRALPAPTGRGLDGAAYEAPGDELETRLVELWRELLGRERIGRADDFFDLGGDSILANRCLAALRDDPGVDIPLRHFFQRPTIKALAGEIREQRPDSAPISIPRAPAGVDIPLSFPQERLWFIQVLDPGNTSYFVPRVIRITGPTGVTLLERTFSEIIRRHHILRTVFVSPNDRPVQRVQPPYDFRIPVMDWSGMEEPRQTRRIALWIAEEGRRPFDLENGPLLRVTLLKLKEQEHLLVLTEHHLIHDGWTQGVLLNEFITIFSAYLENREHGLASLPLQYGDFAYWQRNYLQGDVLERHLDYWKIRLDGIAPLLELPANRVRPQAISGRGDMEEVHLSAPFTRRLKEYSRASGVTLFMTMLAAFKVLLHRYSGMEDICVGTGIANRRCKEVEGMLGMVINTLPLRTRVQGDISFAACLDRVKQTCLEAYQHQDAPFSAIVEAAAPERSLSYNPLFQVMFSFMDTPGEDLRLPGLDLHLEPTHNRSAKFDINIVVVPPREEDGQTLVEWEYSTDIFDPATMRRMLNHYVRLLEAVTAPGGGAQTAASLPILSQDERELLLYEWNDTARDYPRDKTIYRLFEEQVEQTPDHIAVLGRAHELHELHERDGSPTLLNYLTYRELNEKAGQVAALLRERGVQPNDIAAIMIPRSIGMIAGILGILKAGGAYLPIAPDYPRERIDYMLKDSGARLLLTKEDAAFSRLPAPRMIPLPGGASEGRGGSLAYVIYTSGTTGRPKAVMVTHTNVVRLVKNTDYITFGTGERILPTGALEFDASTFEIWGGLLNGLALCLVDNDTILSPGKLKEAVRKYAIDIMWLTAPLFNQLTDADLEIFDGPGSLLAGGDKLSPPHINRLRNRFPRLNIINGYGPTENTTFSTTHLIEKEYTSNIPIGRPIANSTAYIVDRAGNLSPIGVPGELIAGGDGVARGYLNRPELTAERFCCLRRAGGAPPCKNFSLEYTGTGHVKQKFLGVQGPFFKKVPGRRRHKTYKTGDLARWLADGVIEFLGRLDSQVKIRGFRVELGEIESCLLEHEHIRDAAVLVREDGGGDSSLCAYIVSDTAPSAAELRESLAARLPEYMIPAYFMELDALPLTPNGKIDRKALPQPGVTADVQYRAPSDAIEKKLTGLWAQSLGIAEHLIGVDSNYFHLGGHSLKAIMLAARIQAAFNTRLPLSEIFKRPTIGGLASYIRSAGRYERQVIEPVELKEYYPLSPAQKRLYILQQRDSKGTAYNIPARFQLEGQLNAARLEQVFARLIERHESLRTSFVLVKGEPFQRVHDTVDFSIQYETGAGSNDEKRITGDERAFIRPFDLEHAPLMRVSVTEESPDRRIMAVDMHHIITDGTSMGILIREFMALYAGEELTPPALQYKDFSGWRAGGKQQEALKKQEDFWLKQFSGEVPVLDLLVDYPGAGARDFAGDAEVFHLGPVETLGLKQLAREENVTLYMVLLAVTNVLLARLSDGEDIVTGTPIAGRGHEGLRSIVGMFVNTLALRNVPTAAKPFRQFLNDVKERTLEAFENQDYPFDDLAGKVDPACEAGRNPLFDVMFSMQNMDIPALEIPGLRLTPCPHQTRTAKFPLTLTGTETADDIEFRLEYRTALFKQETIHQFIDYFRQIIGIIIEDRDIRLGEIDASGLADTQVDAAINQEIQQSFEF